MSARWTGAELVERAARARRRTRATKRAQLERTAARMRERNRGWIARRARARRQPRTPDGRRFAKKTECGATD